MNKLIIVLAILLLSLNTMAKDKAPEPAKQEQQEIKTLAQDKTQTPIVQASVPTKTSYSELEVNYLNALCRTQEASKYLKSLKAITYDAQTNFDATLKAFQDIGAELKRVKAKQEEGEKK